MTKTHNIPEELEFIFEVPFVEIALPKIAKGIFVLPSLDYMTTDVIEQLQEDKISALRQFIDDSGRTREAEMFRRLPMKFQEQFLDKWSKASGVSVPKS